eukprot:1144894-Pelagomonas_calceolata.AAC.10
MPKHTSKDHLCNLDAHLYNAAAPGAADQPAALTPFLFEETAALPAAPTFAFGTGALRLAPAPCVGAAFAAFAAAPAPALAAVGFDALPVGATAPARLPGFLALEVGTCASPGALRHVQALGP